MIQANELRQNNWVLLTKDGFKTSKQYQLTAFDIYKADESDCADIEPIKLTEDILLKCGFMIREKLYSINVGGELFRYAILEKINEERKIIFVIYFDKKRGWTMDGVVKHKETVFINSVHQLQNLYFARTQTELEINL